MPLRAKTRPGNLLRLPALERLSGWHIDTRPANRDGHDHATPKKDLTPEPKEDPRHAASFEQGSRLAGITGGRGEVNSSHHQAVAAPGRGLRVTARADDGTVEGVEWTGDANWVVGVQWHPERMFGDASAERLFADLVAAGRKTRHHLAEKV